MKISFTKGDETALEISDETRALLRAEALRLLNEAQADYETSASEFKAIADPNKWDVAPRSTSRATSLSSKQAAS